MKFMFDLVWSGSASSAASRRLQLNYTAPDEAGCETGAAKARRVQKAVKALTEYLRVRRHTFIQALMAEAARVTLSSGARLTVVDISDVHRRGAKPLISPADINMIFSEVLHECQKVQAQQDVHRFFKHVAAQTCTVLALAAENALSAKRKCSFWQSVLQTCEAYHEHQAAPLSRPEQNSGHTSDSGCDVLGADTIATYPEAQTDCTAAARGRQHESDLLSDGSTDTEAEYEEPVLHSSNWITSIKKDENNIPLIVRVLPPKPSIIFNNNWLRTRVKALLEQREETYLLRSSPLGYGHQMSDSWCRRTYRTAGLVTKRTGKDVRKVPLNANLLGAMMSAAIAKLADEFDIPADFVLNYDQTNDHMLQTVAQSRCVVGGSTPSRAGKDTCVICQTYKVNAVHVCLQAITTMFARLLYRWGLSMVQ